jgi:pyruvate,water dikinase
MRATARRTGHLLARDGTVDDPDDVFMLTADEFTGALRADIKTLIAARRERYETYRGQKLPRVWSGNPDPVAITQTQSAQTASTLCGVGAAPGLAEGRARVVIDPADIAMEPGDVLIAHTTDPSWASVMFLASALVVDVGGLLSHAAVVARELGIPCVMGTETGTTDIADGDLCRVDGSAGRVEIVARRPREHSS